MLVTAAKLFVCFVLFFGYFKQILNCRINSCCQWMSWSSRSLLCSQKQKYSLHFSRANGLEKQWDLEFFTENKKDGWFKPSLFVCSRTGTILINQGLQLQLKHISLENAYPNRQLFWNSEIPEHHLKLNNSLYLYKSPKEKTRWSNWVELSCLQLCTYLGGWHSREWMQGWGARQHGFKSWSCHLSALWLGKLLKLWLQFLHL